jgi:hypothetical protein
VIGDRHGLPELTAFGILKDYPASKGHQDTIYFYLASSESYDTSVQLTLKYTVCGQEVISLNNPLRAIFLLSRDGLNAYDQKQDHLAWYSVDYSSMDTTTYPKHNECIIDDYTVIEDSYNAPTLIQEGKECTNFYANGKSIYPSVELCADAVKANSANCASGDGYFFYSTTQKVCRCCTTSDATTNSITST